MGWKKNMEKEKIHFGNFEANISFLVKNRLILKRDKILEIGSGKGVRLNYLFRRGFDIRGIEVNKDFYKRSIELYDKDLPISMTEGTKLNFKDNSFDIVISFDVLEHIPDTDSHLREVYRVLKTNGKYIFGIPNKLTAIPFAIIVDKSFANYKKDHCSLHSYWGIKKRSDKNGFTCKFYNISIMNDFLKSKIEKYLGIIGIILIKVFNPDTLPKFLKPTLYIVAGEK